MANINWLGEGWANVGLRLDKDRACYVGATFSQRQEKRCPDVYLQRWPNVTAYVGPTDHCYLGKDNFYKCIVTDYMGNCDDFV